MERFSTIANTITASTTNGAFDVALFDPTQSSPCVAILKLKTSLAAVRLAGYDVNKPFSTADIPSHDAERFNDIA